MIEVDVVDLLLAAPGKYFLEERQKPVAFDLREEIHLVLLFLDAHFVEHFVVVVDADGRGQDRLVALTPAAHAQGFPPDQA